MDDNIKEKVLQIIAANPISVVIKFATDNGASPGDVENEDRLAVWIMKAPANVKYDFLNAFNDWDDPSLRICDNCGDFMDEGYLLDVRYACSDKCAIDLYDGDEKQLREDIGDGSGDFFWTQWY